MKSFDDYEEATNLDFDWHCTEKTYRADPALNFHKLAQFHWDPKAFRDGFFNDESVTDAMRFGTALHAKVLTPNEYGSSIAIFNPPVNPKTDEPYGPATKTYVEARNAFLAQNSDKTIVSMSDAILIERIANEFNLHPIAPKLFENAKCEQAVRGQIKTSLGDLVSVKGRIDAYTDSGLIDIKTTATLDDVSGRDRFLYTIYDHKYLVQLAFYHKILTDCYGAPFVPCWIVAFEKNAPNRIAVYAPSRKVIEDARQVVDAWLCEWVNAGQYCDYQSKYDHIQFVDGYDPSRDI